MKVFFSTTPRTKSLYKKYTDQIYQVLRNVGVTLTDDILEEVTEQEFYAWNNEKRHAYYQSTIQSIKDADVAIFEATLPSIGVGHLIAKALSFGKPVIVLYTDGKKPFMLDSSDEEKVILVEYNASNLKQEIENTLAYAKEKSDVRFNFFLSPALLHYLEWSSQKRNKPKSVILREYIEEAMRKDKAFRATTF